MSAEIKLTIFGPDLQAPRSSKAWPLVILAAATDMPSEIFVYKAIPAASPIPGDIFEVVASVSQMYELPASRGVSVTRDTAVPFYRSRQLEFVCRSPEEAQELIEHVTEDVESLVANWNAALNLNTISQVTVTAEGSETSTSLVVMPERFVLSYHPAGTSTLDDSVQGITGADPTKAGWLPASSAPSNWAKPSNAFLYYNRDKDSALNAAWPPLTPYTGHQLYRNGLLLPYNVVYTITAEALWWLNFNPDLIPGYTRADGQEADGNAPWPLDYVSQNAPGEVAPQIALLLFR